MEVLIIIESIILLSFGLVIFGMHRRIKYLEGNQVDVVNLEKQLQFQNAKAFNAIMTKVDEINPNKTF